MHFLLSLIGFFLLFVFGIVAFVAFWIYSGVHRLRQTLKGGSRTGGSGSSSSREHYNQYTRRATRTSDGTTIIDQRSPDAANKKIFAPDEGEYVDYTEE